MEHEPTTNETIEHVLLNCSMYNQLRQQLITQINQIIPHTPLTIPLLLMSDNVLKNLPNNNIRHQMCSITGQYLADVLHARTRAIWDSNIQQQQHNDDDNSADNDQLSTQYTHSQYSQPIATRTRSQIQLN